MSEPRTDAFLPLASIKPRPGGDTRALNASHVVDLAESISALGVITPIAVDQHRHLLAGAHRLAACRLLVADPKGRTDLLATVCEGTSAKKQAKLCERLSGLLAPPGIEMVPVRVVQIDVRSEQDLALAIETAENALRRDYTPQEVRELYDRLIAAGYTDREGKPRATEKAAKPAIAAIIGRSVRTVRRHLAAAEEQKHVTRTDAGLQVVTKVGRHLRRAVEDLKQWLTAGTGAPTDVLVLLAALDNDEMRRLVQAARASLGDNTTVKGKKATEIEDEDSDKQAPEPIESSITTSEGPPYAADVSVIIEPEASRAPVSDQVESKESGPGAEHDNQLSLGVETEQGGDVPAVGENEISLKAKRTAMQDQAPEAQEVSDGTDASNGVGAAVGAGSDDAQRDGEKRTYTRHAPTNDQLDLWASRWGVQIPRTITRHAVWVRYRELITLAAAEHGVDLSELPESHWRDSDLPAAKLIEEAVGADG